MSAPESVGLVSIGFSTAEAIPLYHVLSGGSLLRVVPYVDAEAAASPPECEGFESLTELYKSSIAGPPLKFVTPEQLERLARSWKVNGVIIEGYQVSRLSEFLSRLKGLNVMVGARTILGDVPKGVDFLLADAIGTCDPSYEIPGHLIDRTLGALRSQGTWVEVAAYLKDPIAESVLGLAYITSDHGVPLHVFLLEHKGGGAVRDMYERLRHVNPFTYIHVELYSELITFCPRCGSPVAYRDEGVLRSLELSPSGGCWRCGAPLPFLQVVAKKTPERVLMLSGGQTRWYDPRAVMRV
ncbi:MAG: hypothetical protein ACP5FT_02985 [Acidilobus sp.]